MAGPCDPNYTAESGSGHSLQGRPSGKSSHVRCDADSGPNSASQRNDAKCHKRNSAHSRGEYAQRSSIWQPGHSKSIQDASLVDWVLKWILFSVRLNRKIWLHAENLGSFGPSFRVAPQPSVSGG